MQNVFCCVIYDLGIYSTSYIYSEQSNDTYVDTFSDTNSATRITIRS